MKSAPCPTPAQRAVLELLADGAVLTVRQIHEYLKLDCGKRALERLLVRLEAHGWVRRLAIYPERGRASEQGWLLCPAEASPNNLPDPKVDDVIQDAGGVRWELDRVSVAPIGSAYDCQSTQEVP